MYGIGAKLREERLRQKLVLDDIARNTRISARYLQAIEDEDYTRLPGLVFSRNFVRQYAIELKLDPEPLVASMPKLDESMVQLPDPPARKRSRSWHTRTSPVLSSALWLLLLGGAATAGYYHFNGFPTLHLAWSLPSLTVTANNQVTPTASQPTPEPVAPAVEELNPAPVPDGAELPPVAAALPPAPLSPVAAVSPSAPVSGTVVAAAAAPIAPVNRAVQVVVTAHDMAWVQVTADGKAAYTGTLRPNETRAISADGQVRVLTGNAGGLTISLNGKTLDPLGPVGQVRSVRLTAEGPEFPAAKAVPVADPL